MYHTQIGCAGGPDLQIREGRPASAHQCCALLWRCHLAQELAFPHHGQVSTQIKNHVQEDSHLHGLDMADAAFCMAQPCFCALTSAPLLLLLSIS